MWLSKKILLHMLKSFKSLELPPAVQIVVKSLSIVVDVLDIVVYAVNFLVNTVGVLVYALDIRVNVVDKSFWSPVYLIPAEITKSHTMRPQVILTCSQLASMYSRF